METLIDADSDAHRMVRSAVAGRLGNSVVMQLQPIIDAIAASLREGRRFEKRYVSVMLPVVEGQTLVVSVHTRTAACLEPQEFPARGLDARQLQVINGAIDEKIGETISVSMLSSLAGLSRSRFSQAFRRSVGRTPHEHVVRVRIERAMELMLESDAPLSEIALETGFCDQAHFTNAFRRAADMTPTQWRKHARSGAHVAHKEIRR
jgi:AraC-like DNA-binding protein